MICPRKRLRRTNAVTPRQLAEMADLDFEVAKALYGAYAVDHDEYGKIINGRRCV